jgi:uncharacterized membrane protein
MTETTIILLRSAAILGCGLMAGVFFAFSTAVMSGLARLEPAQGIAAMQSINRTIVNPLFLTVFLGTAAVCAVVLFASVFRWSNPGTAYLLIGSAVYLVGSLAVTAVMNVPMNDTLDTIAPNASESAKQWASYLTNWTAWNHVRTGASFVATVLLIAARL